MAFSAEGVERSGDGLLEWIKTAMSIGHSRSDEVAIPPVVLRTWPPEVIGVMEPHGAYKVNHWESEGIQAEKETADDTTHRPDC